MELTREMLLRIKQEIADDPDSVGYAGKTNAEIAALLNSNVVKTRTVEDIFPSPLNRILVGMGQGPNAIDATEVGQAKLT